MHPGALRDALTLLAGAGSGLLSGIFGVGGGVVSKPAIRVLGASATIAVGTTLPAIFPSAVTGTFRYAREKLIPWRAVAWTAPAGLLGSVGGSLLSKVVPGHGHWLQVMVALLLANTAWRMARGARAAVVIAPTAIPSESDLAPDPAHGTSSNAIAASNRPHPLLLAGIGLLAGGLSGLLGIGGGVLLVPALSELAKLPLKTAIAASLVCVGVFAVPGTIAHSLLGDIDWHFALALVAGVVPGAWIGSAAAVRAEDRRLRLAAAGFFGVIAVVYAAAELLALA